MLPIIYGISNCDTVRKARKWLADQGIEYQFVDVRDTPPTRERIGDWIASAGKEVLVNKRSTTWKNMDNAEREEAENGDTLAVLLSHPTLIKRPVLEHNGAIDVGFNADNYGTRFNV